MTPTACLAERLTSALGDCRVRAAFFTTYTFARSFFEGTPLNIATSQRRSLGRAIVSVVMDRKHYEGSGVGYDVSFGPGTTFHPKIVVLLAEGPSKGRYRTVIAVGSGNLTSHGWERNQELFHVDVRDQPYWSLPEGLRQLLWDERMKDCRFARFCVDQGVRRRNYRRPWDTRLLTSIDEPLCDQVALFADGQQWSKAHVVAPFANATEDPAPGNPMGFFPRLLKHAQSGAELHVHLRGLDQTRRGKPVAMGDRATFERLSKCCSEARVRLWLHVVEPAPKGRLLHGKLFAWRVGSSWSLLVGSPNATGSAMTQPNANVEAAWELQGVGADLPEGLVLKSKGLAWTAVEYSKVEYRQTKRWAPILRAVWEPKRGRVRLEWAGPGLKSETTVFFGGKQVSPDAIDIRGTKDRFVETRKSSDGDAFEAGYTPIELPEDEVDEAAVGLDRDLSPDELLDLLGSECQGEEEEGNAAGGGKSTVRRGSAKDWDEEGFDWHGRVERLDGQLHGLRVAIGRAADPAEVERIRRTLIRAWAAHDPGLAAESELETAWRRWVRAGLWQALKCDKHKVRKPIAQLRSKWERHVDGRLQEMPIGNY